jgi:hypothetical protein
MTTKPMYIRAPQRTRDLIEAIRAKTGFTLTQIIIEAVQCLADKYRITSPPPSEGAAPTDASQ